MIWMTTAGTLLTYPWRNKVRGAEKKPIPARDSEIKKIIYKAETLPKKVELDIQSEKWCLLSAVPFADFSGTVTEVYPDKEKIRANVSIFGRETPVELEYNQIQKQS